MFYEESYHVPLIISHRSIRGGRVDKTNLISTGLDVLPTIFDLAGIDPTLDFEGKSLKKILENAEHKLDREMVPVECATGLATVSSDFLYAIYTLREGSNNEQLYDLRKRPLQMENDAINPEYKSALEKHREGFETVHAETLKRCGYSDKFMTYLADVE